MKGNSHAYYTQTLIPTKGKLLTNKLLCPVPSRYNLILSKTGRPGTQPVLLIVMLLIAHALATAYGLPWLQRASQTTDYCRIV